ncbi:hypothetical protein TSOC_003545, partial [Tetrabaena socialis]
MRRGHGATTPAPGCCCCCHVGAKPGGAPNCCHGVDEAGPGPAGGAAAAPYAACVPYGGTPPYPGLPNGIAGAAPPALPGLGLVGDSRLWSYDMALADDGRPPGAPAAAAAASRIALQAACCPAASAASAGVRPALSRVAALAPDRSSHSAVPVAPRTAAACSAVPPVAGSRCSRPQAVASSGSRMYPCQSILVHEVGHAVLNCGLGAGGVEEVMRAFREAMKARLYPPDCYMATNEQEYWAVAVESWFESTVRRPAAPLHDYLLTPALTRLEQDVNGGVANRDALRRHDPRLAALLAAAFGDGEWRYWRDCPRPLAMPTWRDRRPTQLSVGGEGPVGASGGGGGGGTFVFHEGEAPAPRHRIRALLRIAAWALVHRLPSLPHPAAPAQVYDVYGQLQRLYGELDGRSLAVLLAEATPTLRQHWEEMLQTLGGKAAGQRGALSEKQVAEPLAGYFAYGLLRAAEGVEQSVTLPPRAVFGARSADDAAAPESAPLASLGPEPGAAPTHGVVEAADARSGLRAARSLFLSRG